MKITPDWKDSEGKGLKDIGWALEYEGSIESDEAIEIEIGQKWLKLSGSLASKLSITADWGIEAGSGIKAGWGIEAGSGIKAGLSITCTKTLKFRFNLFAGTASWKKPTSKEQMVQCGELQGGEIKFGTLQILKTNKEGK